jgi:putative endonuclease
MFKCYSVYIMSNKAHRLYTGITSNLPQRVLQHKHHTLGGFTAQYHFDRLVYFEHFRLVHNAIAREKQIKGWLRAKKLALIAASNPWWHDLSAEWYETEPKPLFSRK